MTDKRFYLNEGDVGILKILDIKEDNERIYLTSSKSDMKMVVELLNELHEENEKQKTTIRMLEQQSQRQINRNDRLHKDWDKLYQHLLDMGLMTDEEILKVIE